MQRNGRSTYLVPKVVDPLDIDDANNLEQIQKINARFDAKVMSRLNNAKESRVVIIAHRAGVLQRVDRLLTIKDGKVQLQGPREEVLGKLRTVAPIGRPS